MILRCLGSSSSGNCYILENHNEALIIEAGVSIREVKIALNFNISKIVGVITTHWHMDHSAFAKDFEKIGIPVYKPYMTDKKPKLRAGKFQVQAFENRTRDGKWLHNNTDDTECPCYGYYIYHPDMGTMVFATDTEFVKYKFRNLNHIVVEANYSDEIVDPDVINKSHIFQGHMSLNTAIDFIKSNDNPALKNVILIHLSSVNSDEQLFLQKTKENVGRETDVYIADKGLVLDLNLLPF